MIIVINITLDTTDDVVEESEQRGGGRGLRGRGRGSRGRGRGRGSRGRGRGSRGRRRGQQPGMIFYTQQ